MSADITEFEGMSLMAANVERGHPWHRLGQQVHKDMSIEVALELSGSDDHVLPITLQGIDPETGEPVTVESHVGIYSDRFGVMSVASPSYEITQRREIVELAYEITGLSDDSAHIDTMGNLGPQAQKFFAYIRVPDLVIDESGIADTIERGLFVATSFDGTLPNIMGYSNIRVVCSNTLSMAMKNVTQAVKVKHTRNAEDRMKVAAQALGYVGAVEKAVVKRAEDMLRVTDGDKALQTVLDNLWPIDDKDLPDSTKTRRLNERGDVRVIYEGKDNLNVDKVGRNGYAAYNAVVEYLDHARGVRGSNGDGTTILMKRSEAAVLPGQIVDKKIKVSELVLSASSN